MRYDSCQFGPFDSPDNRKAILDCFRRMGKNLPDDLAGSRRAGFLEGMRHLVKGGLKGRPILIDGCPSAGEAYDLLVAIVTGTDVPIETAAVFLEKAVRYLELKDLAELFSPPKEWWLEESVF